MKIKLRMKYCVRCALILIALLLSVSFSFSQKGTIRGKVIEEATGEFLTGATVVIKEKPGVGTITDLDGEFSLQIEPGIYSAQVSFISFQALVIEKVKVSSGEVTVLNNLSLKEDNMTLGEVVVTAEAVKSSEIALMSMRKKSQALMDGISAAKMDQIGDATAVEAVKRVTGVTIEGGKYVYVRGLGDRYSKTTLNGVDIPGLDPDRNTLQMDIFPTNLVSNITVGKNFTADMPADFTGGLLNIETVSFPEREIMKLSVGTGYNPNSNFNSDFLTYEGSGTDFLGFDGGERALPTYADQEDFPSPISGASLSEVNTFLKSFSPELAAKKQTSFLDYSLSYSYGNQIDLKNGDDDKSPKLGYLFSISYKSDYNFYQNAEDGEYQRAIPHDEYELLASNVKTGDIGEHNVLLGVLGGVAYKTNLSKVRMVLMHLQNGESTATKQEINNYDIAGQSGYYGVADILKYSQRSLSNLFINGTHVLDVSGWEVDWRVSPTYSIANDPDIRKTAFTVDGGDIFFNAGSAGYPTRTWRYLNEINLVSKIDINKKHTLFGEDASLKLGLSETFKYRHYEILGATVQFFGSQPEWPEADASLVYQAENLYPDGTIYYMSGNPDPNPNEYQSSIQNLSLYVSEEFTIFPNFKGILGIRVEQYQHRYTGRDQTAASSHGQSGYTFDNEKMLDAVDFFPSVNFIYDLTEKQKIRIAYSRTIARPSFKEMSYAQIIDPVSDRIFNGGLYNYGDEWSGDLHETRINNIDLRWEFFMERGQVFSVSGFYKQFDDPLELVRLSQSSVGGEYQIRNVEDGELLGVEVEAVKGLDFISPFLEDFNISGNLTIVESRIELTDKEYNSKMAHIRDGETLDKYRQMAGQSPYVINGGLSYNSAEKGIGIGLYYNIKGPTLEYVGVRNITEVYSSPFHSLNFSANYKFGKDKRMGVDFKVSNILDNKEKSVFISYQAADQIYKSRYNGRSFSAGFSYKF